MKMLFNHIQEFILFLKKDVLFPVSINLKSDITPFVSNRRVPLIIRLELLPITNSEMVSVSPEFIVYVELSETFNVSCPFVTKHKISNISSSIVEKRYLFFVFISIILYIDEVIATLMANTIATSSKQINPIALYVISFYLSDIIIHIVLFCANVVNFFVFVHNIYNIFYIMNFGFVYI